MSEWKCLNPEVPYCPTCEHGMEYREPWWEDGHTEWICFLNPMPRRQRDIIRENNIYY